MKSKNRKTPRKNVKTTTHDDNESWLREASQAPSPSMEEVLEINPLSKPIAKKHSQNTVSKRNDFKTNNSHIKSERYQIETEHAKGGLGRIWKAKDKKLDRCVALKELLRCDVEAIQERFLQEALITAKLQHPSIVPIHDLEFRKDGVPYYTMKFVEGRSLQESIATCKNFSKRLSLLSHVIDAVEAIAYAHSQNIIHRDLKPQNILLGEFGETVVIDWGLAKELSRPETSVKTPGSFVASDQLDEGLTIDGTVLGTPAYMPPEQARGDSVDKRADVYALGAILYHLLAGTPPYEGTHTRKILFQVLKNPPQALETRVPVPQALLSIVKRAMARDPEERFLSAKEFVTELKRFQQGQLVNSHPYSKKELFFHFTKRHLGAVVVGLIAVFLLIVSGYFYYENLNRAYQREIAARILAENEQQKAETNEQEAIKSVTSLLKEQGRQELLALHPERAAVFLSEAYQNTKILKQNDSNLRLLLAKALKPFDAQLFVLEGHKDQIKSATYSPGGTQIVSTSADNTARVWDANTGKLLLTLPLETNSLFAIHSPDEKQIATIDTKDNSYLVTLWDAKKGDALFSLAHEVPVHDALYSPDSSQIVTMNETLGAIIWRTSDASILFSIRNARFPDHFQYSPDSKTILAKNPDGTVTLWDASQGKTLFTIAHKDTIWSANFSSDGNKIVTASENGIVNIWNAKNGILLVSLAHENRVRTAQFSSDGNNIITAGYDYAWVWDIQNNKVLNKLQHAKNVFVQFSPDETRILTLSENNTAKLWNTSDGTLVSSLEKASQIQFVHFSPNGKQFLSSDLDNTIKIWSVQTGSLLLVIRPSQQDQLQYVEYSPDGKQILIRDSSDAIKVWRVENLEEPLSVFHQNSENIRNAVYSTNANFILINSENNVILRNAKTKKLLLTLEHADIVQSVVYSPTRKQILSTSGSSAKLWDATNGNLLFSFAHKDTVWSANFSSDGNKIVTASSDGTAKIWSAKNGTLISVLEHSAPVWSANFSPDNSEILTIKEGKETRVLSKWDVSRIQPLQELPQFINALDAVDSPDNSQILTVNADNSAKLWDATNGNLLFSFAHKDTVWSANFSSDGNKIVTASSDGTAKIWSAKNGTLLQSTEYSNGLLSADYSPDDNKILLTSADNTILIWKVFLETRSPEEISKTLEEKSSWRLDKSTGTLVSKNDSNQWRSHVHE